MKLKTSILYILLMCALPVSAQNLTMDVQMPSLAVRQDSAVLSFRMSVSVLGMETNGHILLTPTVSANGRTESMPQIRINGERAHRVYQRSQLLNRRRNAQTTEPAVAFSLVDGRSHSFVYRAAMPAADWMRGAEIRIRKEIINASGKVVNSEQVALNVGGASPSNVARSEAVASNTPTRNEVVPVTTNRTATESNAVAETLGVVNLVAQNYKGSYIVPEVDATDERNQRELDFSLDEARVIAEVNPEMLSLRELYTVAVSYKTTPDRFYRIIETSVRIYPASPEANLNAAAAAIERGDLQLAARYLRMATHDTLAYKNCRGAYELLCNNTAEGIRLLKAAKAEGSEEAAYNLKLFFESNQPKQ